jgi:predicted aspartyl protease
MGLFGRRVLQAAVASCLAAYPLVAEAGPCPPERLASFPLAVTPSGLPYVPVTLGGRTVQLKVDTGGMESTLGESVAREMNMPFGTISNYKLTIGNDAITHYTTAHNVDFGGRTLPSMAFMIMPNGHLEQGIDGTLGPNVLRQYGVEIDSAGGKLNLFSSQGCTGNPAYWTTGQTWTVPIALWRIGLITTNVTIDGKTFTAVVDTAQSETSIALDAAERIGFTEQSPDLKPAEDEGEGIFRYPFKTLSFENGPSVANPKVLLIRHDRMKFNEEMELGMDLLRQFHVYISYGGKMYLTAADAH